MFELILDQLIAYLDTSLRDLTNLSLPVLLSHDGFLPGAVVLPKESGDIKRYLISKIAPKGPIEKSEGKSTQNLRINFGGA
jgi:hypothetical protein